MGARGKRLKVSTFIYRHLQTSWSSSRSLDRPSPQRHWICSCQPLGTDRQAILRGHGGATRRPELATRWWRRLTEKPWPAAIYNSKWRTDRQWH